MQQAEAQRKSEVALVVADIRANMQEYGLTVADLEAERLSRARGRAVAPKFRNPATGETWAERGKKPRGLVAQIEAGKTIESFLI